MEDGGKIQEEQSELETEQQSLAPLLGKLFKVFGVPELVDNGKTKYDQIMGDAFIPSGLKNSFTLALFDKVDTQNAVDGDSQWQIMKDIVSEDSNYLAQGPDIPLSEIEAQGGMTRVIPLKTIWNENLTTDYKTEDAPTFEDWLELIGGDNSYFAPDEHIQGGAPSLADMLPHGGLHALGKRAAQWPNLLLSLP